MRRHETSYSGSEHSGTERSGVPRRSARLLRSGARGTLVLAGVFAALLSGCSLVYSGHCRGSRFIVYSDRDPAFIEATTARIETIYRHYQELFQLEPSSLGTTTILLEGSESSVVDFSYTPSLLGYYVPFLNLISIDTEPAVTRQSEILDQVLLHEVAHHFIFTEHPAASRECWLNEGLAGTLEMTRLTEGKAEYPLLNPALLQVARETAMADTGPPPLKDLLDRGWSSFHAESEKESNYALSWSLVYFLLRHKLPQDLPLGRRIEALYRLDRDAIAAVEEEWLAHLRGFDLTVELSKLALCEDRDLELTALWAIQQLGELKNHGETRTVEGLLRVLEVHDGERQAAGCVALLGVLERNPQLAQAPDSAAARGLARVLRALTDREQPLQVRERLLAAVRAEHGAWESVTAALISILDDPNASLRAAAAAALTRLAGKPTIANPSFWHYASASERDIEVQEWRTWLESRRG
jgi:hypothetical protein